MVDRIKMVVVMIVGMIAIDAMSDRMMIDDTSVDTTIDETTATTIAVVVPTMIDTIDTMIDANRTMTDGTRIATIDDAMAIDVTRGIRIATTDDGTTRRDTIHTNVILARHLRLQPSREIRDKKIPRMHEFCILIKSTSKINSQMLCASLLFLAKFGLQRVETRRRIRLC
jgi:hypothetical protein